MKKNFIRNWLILIGVVVVVGVGVKVYWGYLNSAVNSSEPSTKAFVIQKGESVTSIAEHLKQEGLIRSPLAFKVALKLSGVGVKIEAGDFKLSPSMSIKDLMSALQNGATDKWVTLLEGWRLEQVADELNRQLTIDKGQFLKVAREGYMFPDTYLFNKEASAETIASTLENTFDQRYDEELKAKVRARGLTEQQGVILASIVEREARSDEVRTKVASILLKRFKIGMALNADATVQYAKDSQALKMGNLAKFWQPVTTDDYKEIVSPYNTYLNAGLPPTPICNPGLSSIKAVASADPSTPYLFYYHDSQGNSYYAKTLEEHNQNVRSHP